MTGWSEGPGALGPDEPPARTPLWGGVAGPPPTEPLPQHNPPPGAGPAAPPGAGPAAPLTQVAVVERAGSSGWDEWNWPAPTGHHPVASAVAAPQPAARSTGHVPPSFAVPDSVPDSTSYGPPQAWGSAAPPLAPAGPPGRGRGPGWPAVIGVAVVTGLIAALLGGLVGAGLRDGMPGVLPTAASGSTVRPEGSVARIAADALPSIVTIRAAGDGGSGTGSGFVYDNSGHIVTNNHVVEGVGEDIVVVLSSGERIEPSVVGTDAAYDIAVLATNRTNLRALPIGDSEAVVVGDPVLAVGAPLGLTSTVTSGIVSAIDRPVVAGDATTRSYINAIQTDAAINPGNSGGPLLDAAGRMIGMNSAIAAPPGTGRESAGNIGLGFAIPSAQVVKTAGQLITKGSAEHPVIGVLLDENYAGQGAKVRESGTDGHDPITANGPADKAGVQPGDVILRFDGREITDADDLIVAIRARNVGDSVQMTVRRDGRTVDVRMTLTAAPKN